VKKRLLKTAITTALVLAFAAPAFANPFADVPANSWAYGAVTKLAQAGIIDGYGDGTFRGDKTVTRYEMAQMVSKAMNKSMNAEQKATVDKLSREFATELIAMGIKVEGVQQQVDNMVKVSGDARVRYFDQASIGGSNDVTEYRARISFDGKINNDMKFNARLSSGNTNADTTANTVKFDTANVSFNTFGLNTTVGRQDIKLGSGYLMDTQMNGVASQIGGLKLFAGNASQSTEVAAVAPIMERTYGAEYGMNILGAKVTADYLKNTSNNDEFYGANASFGLIKGVSANAEYFKNNTVGATAAAYGVKLDNVGLSATYRDVEKGAFTAYSTMNATTTNFYDTMALNGFKGMEYQFDKDLGKNAIFSVKYQDFKDQTGATIPARTSAGVNVKF
jgi:hypothetical protein